MAFLGQNRSTHSMASTNSTLFSAGYSTGQEDSYQSKLDTIIEKAEEHP
jgi:hypothetical protein